MTVSNTVYETLFSDSEIKSAEQETSVQQVADMSNEGQTIESRRCNHWDTWYNEKSPSLGLV
jgi:hypothetical protein